LPSAIESGPAAEPAGSFGSPVRRALLVAAVFLAVNLPFLGQPPLFDPDEGYYPETAREMLESGNRLDPVFNGEPRWGKPIVFYFVECLSFDLFGASEFSARLPSLLAGLGLALLTLAAGSFLYGPRSGLYAGVLGASALQPVVYSRAAVPDMSLAFFVSLSLYCLIRSGLILNRGSKLDLRWLLAGYAAAGFAFLTKGPLGAILPLITLLAFFLLTRDLKALKELKPLAGLSVFLLVAAPWFLYMTFRHGGVFLHEHFIQGNLDRYFTDRWRHPGTLFYYLPVLLAGTFPWTAAFLGGTAAVLRPLLRRGENKPENKERQADLFLLCWLGGILLFFSLSRSKLPNYVLPLYPAAMLLAGRCLVRLENAVSSRAALLLAWGSAGLAVTAAAAGGPLLARKLGETPGTVLIWLSPLILFVLAAVVYQLGRRLFLWTAVSACGMALLLAVVSGLALPRLDRLQAVRSLSLEHRGELRDSGRIGLWRVWSPSLLFYTSKTVLRLDPADRDGPGTLRREGIRWVLTGVRGLDELELFSGEPLTAVYRSGHLALVRLGPAGP